jgi:RNA-binding protein
MLDLLPTQRRQLRARAHPLHPVVAIGQHGLTASVLHEIDVALLAHELVKVRVLGDDRAEREALLTRICDDLQCAPVQHIGKLLVLWRPNPEKAERVAKKKTAAAPARERKGKPASRSDASKPAPRRGPSKPAPRRDRAKPASARERAEPAPPEPRGDQSRRRRGIRR